ncbi:MAG: hypothetical protein COA79_20510 [Planctomycetota bacterium]|nr:MAG: hypothetical protein COA79_20510 [Planctomycetota bacterium]
MKNSVSIFIADYSIWNSPSLINLLNLLNTKFDLNVFISNTANENIKYLRDNKLNYYLIECIPFRLSFHYFYYQTRTFINFIKLKCSNINNLFCICVDVKGYCQYLIYSDKSSLYYYSLELQLEDDADPDNILSQLKKYFTLEKENYIKPKGVLIQSESRKKVFYEQYKLDEIPYMLLPVTYAEKSVYTKKNYIREKYNIDEHKKIILYAGGIHPYYKVLDIIKSLKDNADLILFFQGYSESEYVTSIIKYIKEEKINNVIFSKDRFENIEDVSIIYQSSDIGLAWYDYDSLNFRTAALSSGKVSGYFKYGLPVIVNDLCGGKEAVENINCGISVKSYDEILNAVELIMKNYAEYSSNARLKFDDHYNFNHYEDKLLSFFEK